MAPIVIIGGMLSAILYGTIAIIVGRDIKTPYSYFHLTKKRNAYITIAAGNLTLGTGLLYLTDLAKNQQAFAWLACFGVFAGYFLLAALVRRIRYIVGENKNIYGVINKSSASHVAVKLIILSLVASFLFILALEIYASSSFVAALIDPSAGAGLVYGVAIVLCCIALGYTVIGGLWGIVKTDLLQIFFIGIMVLLLFATSFQWLGFNLPDIVADQNSEGTKSLEGQGGLNILLALSAFAVAVSTQLYNIVNISVGANFQPEQQAAVFRKAGIGLTIAFAFFVLVGLVLPYPTDDNFGGLTYFFGALAESRGVLQGGVVFFISFGMIAILLSSIDSFLIAMSQITYDQLWERDSYSKEEGTARPRLLTFGIGIFAVVPILALFVWEPQIIELLLTVLFFPTILGPLVIGAALQVTRSGKSIFDSWWYVGLVFALGALGWLYALYDVLVNKGVAGPYLSLIGAAIAFVYLAVQAGAWRRKGVAEI